MTATAAPETATPESRDEQGRFAAGHRGGPGNPFARQVSSLRSALLKSVTPGKVASIAAALVEKAERGDVAAARLVLSYTLGKPAPAVDPDRLDLDEWKQMKEEAPLLGEMAAVVAKPPPAFPLDVARGVRPLVAESLRRQMKDAFAATAPSPNGSGTPDKKPTAGPGAVNKRPRREQRRAEQPVRAPLSPLDVSLMEETASALDALRGIGRRPGSPPGPGNAAPAPPRP